MKMSERAPLSVMRGLLCSAALLAGVAALAPVTALAADPAPTVNEKFSDFSNAIAELRTEAGRDRREIVKANMLLTDSEATTFWPLYGQYRTERIALGDRKVKLITDYIANRDAMSEDQATALTKEYFSIDQDKLDLKQKYVKKMSKVLSARTVARYFQIDQKLDAIVDMELAARVPLIH